MNLAFTKMHGLGNDFIVIDASTETLDLSVEQCRWLADRHFGIGCDQILLVEAPRSADTEFYYRIFNADGSEVEQCGNGARCFARFVYAKGLTDNRELTVGTAKGNITLYLEGDDQVRVNMGTPTFIPAEIPLQVAEQQTRYIAQLREADIEFGAVSMGNPHAVIRVEDVNDYPVESIGPEMESHALFPNRVNVGFMAVKDRQHIDLRVFERGSGETLACGTGACAAVVSGHQRGWLDNHVEVSLPGGKLQIHWDGHDQPVWMTGSATFVFEGTVQL